MRQLKQMMRTRKEQMLGCGPCECLTLKCRRENDEFCGCNGGGGGSSKIAELIGFPTDVSISEGTVSTYSFRFAPVKHYDDVSSQITFVDPYNLVEAYVYSRNDNGDARVNFSIPMGRTGSTSLQVYLNGEHYMDTLVQVTPYVYVDSVYNLPNTIDVYTGGGSGSNSEVLQFKFSPTNANNALGEISFENYDGEFIGFLGSTRANFDGDARYSFGPQAGDDQVGQIYNYKAMIRGEYTGQNIGLRLIKGIIPTENYSMDSLSIERGTFNSQDRIEITDNVTDPEELNSVRLEYDPNIVNVSCNAQQDGGRTFLHINVEGVALGDTYVTITFVNGVSFIVYVEVVPNMEDNIINWFVQTPVYTNLTSEQQEQATEDARQIIESAGDDIIPFYTAMQEGRTFANYAEQIGLTPDTSGNCDSSVYTDDEAFIIYIGTAGAVSCEYLALVARRGITPHQELINKQAISDYLDWVTEEGETCTYQFKDWDGEILKFGSVPVGGEPEAPEVPERSGYNFIGWSPEIQQISEDVTFVAQYEQIIPVEQITSFSSVVYLAGTPKETGFTFLPENANDFSGVTVRGRTYDCVPNYTITSWNSTGQGVATVYSDEACEGYGDVNLNGEYQTTADRKGYDPIVMTFTATEGGSVSRDSLVIDPTIELQDVTYVSPQGNELIISLGCYDFGAEVAYPEEGYSFIGWYYANGTPVGEDAITESVEIVARFAINRSHTWNVYAEDNLGTVNVNSITVHDLSTYHFDASTNSISFYDGDTLIGTVVATPISQYCLQGFTANDFTYATWLTDGVVKDLEYIETIDSLEAMFTYCQQHIETITLDGQSGIYGKPITVEEGGSVDVHCTYTPTTTTDFGTVSLSYWSYDEDVASAEFHPQGNGEGYVTFIGLREGHGVAYLELDGERADDVDITVTAPEPSYEPSYESY